MITIKSAEQDKKRTTEKRRLLCAAIIPVDTRTLSRMVDVGHSVEDSLSRSDHYANIAECVRTKVITTSVTRQ